MNRLPDVTDKGRHRFVLQHSQRRFVLAALAAAAVAGLPLSHAQQAAGQTRERPNFILCMADDQGWGDVSYNGHPVLKTPVLDEMAAQGLRFDRFYAAAPVCSPTRGSVLTGRHPNRFGCFSWGHTLRQQEVTIAEALQRAGYATGHFGKWHLGPMRAGAENSPGEAGFDKWVSSPNFYENSPLFSQGGKVIEAEGESSMVTVEAALEFIRSATSRKRPFLAVVWFGNPHTPHQALPELRKLYADQSARLQNYYGEITGIDRAMGRLRRELRELDLAENTLLWYTSDNGARKPGSTGGLRGQKGSLWEGGIRVPAIIEWPAVVKNPSRTDVPCGTVDIYPTLLEIAGVKVPHQPTLDGQSLAPLIEGRRLVRARPLGFWKYPVGGRPMRSTQILQALAREQSAGGGQPDKKEDDAGADRAERKHPLDERPGHAAWIDGNFKLHRLPGKRDEARYELYNLQTDPNEQKDVSAKHPDRVRKMRQDLEDWQKSVIRSLTGEDYAGSS